MKAIIRKIGQILLGLVPYRLGRELFRAWLVALDKREPGQTLAAYFGLADDLTDRLNSTACRYEGGDHPKHRLTDYHRFFSDRVGPGDRVLDVGCGAGQLARDLARTGAEVVGIDFNAESIARAEADRQDGLSFFLADATEQLPPGRFTAIALSNVLEHIDDRVGFLTKLKETGAERFLIRVPAFERCWTMPLRRELGLNYMSDSTHRIEHTMVELVSELAEAGLKIIGQQGKWSEIWIEAVVEKP